MYTAQEIEVLLRQSRPLYTDIRLLTAEQLDGSAVFTPQEEP